MRGNRGGGPGVRLAPAVELHLLPLLRDLGRLGPSAAAGEVPSHGAITPYREARGAPG
ncbi:hypothetical protein [Streptomyces sp. NPDC058045]|uniref:hypothetical protein n=1 Tax=Streptomyces sp. NPDC058045 TaxID=3346311 RepID=UPI0036E66198